MSYHDPIRSKVIDLFAELSALQGARMLKIEVEWANHNGEVERVKLNANVGATTRDGFEHASCTNAVRRGRPSDLPEGAETAEYRTSAAIGIEGITDRPNEFVGDNVPYNAEP